MTKPVSFYDAIADFEEHNKGIKSGDTTKFGSRYYLTFKATTGWQVEKYNIFYRIIRYALAPFGVWSESHRETVISNLRNVVVVNDSELQKKLMRFLPFQLYKELHLTDRIKELPPYFNSLPESAQNVFKMMQADQKDQERTLKEGDVKLLLSKQNLKNIHLDVNVNAIKILTDKTQQPSASPVGVVAEQDQKLLAPLPPLPRAGLPNVKNTCWMNAGCQVVLRTPHLLEEVRKYAREPNADELLKLLNAVIEQMSKDPQASEMIVIMKLLADLMQKRRPEAVRGRQHDTASFLQEVIEVLDKAIWIKQSASVEALRTNPKKHKELAVPYATPGRNIMDALLQNEIAKVKMKANSEEEARMHQVRNRILEVPQVLICRLTGLQTVWGPQALPPILDFKERFGRGIQQQVESQGKKLWYQLKSAVVYDGTGASGHYTALEIQKVDPLKAHLYNDGMPPTEINDPDRLDKYLKTSTYLVWELIDPSLAGIAEPLPPK